MHVSLLYLSPFRILESNVHGTDVTLVVEPRANVPQVNVLARTAPRRRKERKRARKTSPYLTYRISVPHLTFPVDADHHVNALLVNAPATTALPRPTSRRARVVKSVLVPPDNVLARTVPPRTNQPRRLARESPPHHHLSSFYHGSKTDGS